MQKNSLFASCTVLLLFAWFSAQAQNPQFSQYYGTQLYMNPALTGNTLQERFAGTYRNQWPGVNPGYRSFAVAYDHNFQNLNSGLGFMAMRDVAGVGNLSFTKFSGLYSYQFNLTRLHHVRWGVDFGYTSGRVDFSQFTFGDQYLREAGGNTIEAFQATNVNYPDFGTGVVLYSHQYWIGGSLHHINRPLLTFMGADNRIPIKYSAHAGVQIVLEEGREVEPKSSFRVAANYKGEQMWDQFDIGTYLKHGPVLFGLWYRGLPGVKSYQRAYNNNDALVGLVGVEVNQMRLGYSFDLTVSKLSPQSGGAHEITWVYQVASKGRKRKKATEVPCPTF